MSTVNTVNISDKANIVKYSEKVIKVASDDGGIGGYTRKSRGRGKLERASDAVLFVHPLKPRKIVLVPLYADWRLNRSTDR